MTQAQFLSVVSPLQSRIFRLAPGYDLRNPLELAAVLDTVIQKRMERYHIPGFALAIVKDGKLHWSKGYGYADLENKIPVVPDKTIFRIGSITKVFTATAMMQMVDQGKITLHEDISKYTDDKLSYKNNAPSTLHHLLSHSAGFREISGRRTSSADNTRDLFKRQVNTGSLCRRDCQLWHLWRGFKRTAVRKTVGDAI